MERLRSSTWLSGQSRDVARGEADHQVAAAFAQGAQRRLGELSADGIEDNVDALAARELARLLLERLRGGIDRRLGPGQARRRALLGGRAGGDDAGAEGRREIDRRHADPAAASEHEHLLPASHVGALAKCEVCRGVGLGQGRRHGDVQVLWHRDGRGRRDCDPLGPRPKATQRNDPASGCRRVHARPQPLHDAHELAAGHVRHVGPDLVPALHDESVDVVHARSQDPQHHLSGGGLGLHDILDPERLDVAEGVTHHRSHARGL